MAVLEALGKKAGPEDVRSLPQRLHDALEEGCRRLVGSGCLPDRAGQPTQIQYHITLDQLLGRHGGPSEQAGAKAPRWLRDLNPGPDSGIGTGPGGGLGGLGTSLGTSLGGALSAGLDGAAAWAAGRATGDGRPGWILDPVTAAAYACDAQIAPIVTGHVDRVAVALAVRKFLAAAQSPPRGPHDCTVDGCDPAQCTTADHRDRRPVPFTLDELMDLFLQQSIEVLSGPTGLAAHLRAAAGGPAACGASLPLDVGAATATIPPHLRRAVISRDRHCAFPGCHQPPAACQVHHLIPRSEGGTTSLGNMVLLCSFHHLIAIHRWGWTLALNRDGTTTATSPDGQRTFHSHSPPTQTAAS
jgi:hypothetical protein